MALSMAVVDCARVHIPRSDGRRPPIVTLQPGELTTTERSLNPATGCIIAGPMTVRDTVRSISINTSNVKNLVPAFMFSTAVVEGHQAPADQQQWCDVHLNAGRGEAVALNAKTW